MEMLRVCSSQHVIRRGAQLEVELGTDEAPGEAHGMKLGKDPGELWQ